MFLKKNTYLLIFLLLFQGSWGISETSDTLRVFQNGIQNAYAQNKKLNELKRALNKNKKKKKDLEGFLKDFETKCVKELGDNFKEVKEHLDAFTKRTGDIYSDSENLPMIQLALRSYLILSYIGNQANSFYDNANGFSSWKDKLNIDKLKIQLNKAKKTKPFNSNIPFLQNLKGDSSNAKISGLGALVPAQKSFLYFIFGTHVNNKKIKFINTNSTSHAIDSFEISPDDGIFTTTNFKGPLKEKGTSNALENAVTSLQKINSSYFDFIKNYCKLFGKDKCSINETVKNNIPKIKKAIMGKIEDKLKTCHDYLKDNQANLNLPKACKSESSPPPLTNKCILKNGTLSFDYEYLTKCLNACQEAVNKSIKKTEKIIKDIPVAKNLYGCFLEDNCTVKIENPKYGYYENGTSKTIQTPSTLTVFCKKTPTTTTTTTPSFIHSRVLFDATICCTTPPKAACKTILEDATRNHCPTLTLETDAFCSATTATTATTAKECLGQSGFTTTGKETFENFIKKPKKGVQIEVRSAK